MSAIISKFIRRELPRGIFATKPAWDAYWAAHKDEMNETIIPRCFRPTSTILFSILLTNVAR